MEQINVENYIYSFERVKIRNTKPLSNERVITTVRALNVFYELLTKKGIFVPLLSDLCDYCYCTYDGCHRDIESVKFVLLSDEDKIDSYLYLIPSFIDLGCLDLVGEGTKDIIRHRIKDTINSHKYVTPSDNDLDFLSIVLKSNVGVM